jgi:enoyl-CoA hydratase/carnithine racemase
MPRLFGERASRENAAISQFEVGTGFVPGGGPMARLPRLVGRGRAMEILIGADDFSGELAERHGCVNRALPDAELDGFVDALANRIAVRFVYEWRDNCGHWFRSCGNENWEFDENGLMRVRIASINDLAIEESERKYHWLLGRRSDDHLSLSELGLQVPESANQMRRKRLRRASHSPVWRSIAK